MERLVNYKLRFIHPGKCGLRHVATLTARRLELFEDEKHFAVVFYRVVL
jgi:hypothetical protein